MPPNGHGLSRRRFRWSGKDSSRTKDCSSTAARRTWRFGNGKNETPPFFNGDNAWNRYRLRYEELGRNAATFFPDVGIQPVTDGGLLAAALFMSKRCDLTVAAKPRTFLEHIAVSNWCKFTIQADHNIDYIGNLGKLTESLAFVVGELAALQPAVVLLPTQVWRQPILRAAMRGASPATVFVPTFQFNARVVNTRLADLAKDANKLQRQMQGQPIARWMDELKRINTDAAWRYLAFLISAIPSRAIA